MPIINPPPIFMNGNSGLVPDSDDGVTKFLRADGSFNTPPSNAQTWKMVDLTGAPVPGPHSVDLSVVGGHEVDFIGLAGAQSIFAAYYDATINASQEIACRVSTNNGASFYNTSGDYQTLGSGGTLTASSWCPMQVGNSAAARSPYINIINPAMNGCAKYIRGSYNGNSGVGMIMFRASTSPINAIRFIAGSSSQLFTGGYIDVLVLS